MTDVYLTTPSGERKELEDDTLYRVVCDLYSGQMLGAVTDVSYGILSIQPKFADGTPIENIEDAILTTDGKEIKAWAAIAGYMETFPDTDGDGIPNIPSSYENAQNRKTVLDTTNLYELVKNPNKYAVIIVAVILVVLILVILLLVLLIRGIRRLIRRSL